MLIAIKTNTNIALLTCHPAPHAAPIGAGAVQGTNEIVLPTIFQLDA